MSIIGIYSIIGVINTLRLKRWRSNSFILACYPLIFHCSFIVFYLSDEDNQLANAGIVAMITILIGSFHSFITIIT